MLVTSSATRQGLDELRGALLRARAGRPPSPRASGEDEVAEFAVFRPPRRRLRHRARPGGRLDRTGEAVERLFARWDLENEEAQALVERRLRRMGVIRALERAGFEPGDDVEIGGMVFELDPS